MKLPTSKTRRWTLAALGLGAIGAAAWWIAALHAKDTESLTESPVMLRHEGARLFVPERSPLRSSLAIQTVAEHAITAPFVLPAVVEADPGKLVKVLPPIAGRIVRLNKRLGDAVKSGDTLFAIDSSDLAQALSDAKKAESALVLARQNLARQRDLESTNIAAKRDLEQAQNDYEQAASELGRANARLAELGVADTRLASGSTLTVSSPISGRVVELNAGNGGYWNDTTAPIMTVADLSTVFVTGSAQEKDLGHLYVGQEATVSLDAYPDQPLRGKVQRDYGRPTSSESNGPTSTWSAARHGFTPTKRRAASRSACR